MPAWPGWHDKCITHCQPPQIQTHVHIDAHIPADHSTPICSVSTERCTGSTAGLSRLSDGIPRVRLTSSVSLSKLMCCKIINHVMFTESHLQDWRHPSYLPQSIPSENPCFMKAHNYRCNGSTLSNLRHLSYVKIDFRPESDFLTQVLEYQKWKVLFLW